MKYKIEQTKEFLADISKLLKSEPKSFEKVAKFLMEIEEHPRTGTGHPEQLKHFKDETWSSPLRSPVH